VIEKVLPQDQFNTVIRNVKRVDVERLQAFAALFPSVLRRLRKKHNPALAVDGIPNGSDHFDTGSLKDWMAKVMRKDKVAVKQILTIHATVLARLNG